MRIGVISDTHLAGDGRGLPSAVFEVFRGVDLILHCGDLECIGVLDHLETLAPVLAVRGYEDPFEAGERLANPTRVVTAGGLHIGMIHDIQWPGPHIKVGGSGTTLHFPPGEIHETMARKFGRPVDIVAFGDTHEELIAWHRGVLLVNPGSPTCPGLRHRRGDLGTVAILELAGETVGVEIVKLGGDRL